MSFKKRTVQVLKTLQSFRVASEVTSAAVSDFLTALDCPRALTVLMLFREGEHEQLANLEIDPLHYSNAMEFRDAYAATKFLSKFKDLTLDSDLDKVALLKFKKFELQCERTNERFLNLGASPLFQGPVVWLHNAVIRKISSVLGSFDGEELVSLANWGPGATTTITSRDSSSVNKFQLEAGITADLHSLLPIELLQVAYPAWAQHLREIGFPKFQSGNKVVTVPKDATTNRVIAIEPGINLWFQKAIGEMIGKRLRRFSIDLRFQGRNQELARKGSINSSLATIDLSSASDSISAGLVEALLPPRWFSLLDSARSKYGLLDGELFKWNKFSSMGNGFTFQLESLIFYAAADSCREYLHIPPYNDEGQVVSVYGDDIVIPSKCLALFSALLEFYGFTMNMKKSHFSSCFRESCGAHYWAGIDVKPIYLKGRLSDVQSVYRLANAVRRLAHRRNVFFGCDSVLRPTFYHLVRSVPSLLRRWIPESLGDGGFIGNFDEATPVRARHGIEGYFAFPVLDVAKSYESDGIGVMLTRLWVRSMREENNNVPLRNRTSIRIVRSLVKQWADLGPWF